MFWFVENLAKQTMKSGVLPWEFTLPAAIPQQVRHDKKSRQEWYRTASTQHYFYTGLEPANPNMRPSKDNPPRAIHAFCADYDLKIPKERVDEAIKIMPIKPSWTERSLGGNVRLVWLLPRPLYVESYDFCCFVLQEATKWLSLELLPGLDEGAFTTPTRLLCNGAEWSSTGHGAISEVELQSFFISCGRKFRWNGGEGATIPLDVVEARLKEMYPGFNWPSDFTVDSQGPTFWIPESTSPMSAILREEGMISFAAHATKPFYTWTELLGVDFVRQFKKEALSKATSDIWFDGKKFWGKSKGVYVSMEQPEIQNYLRVDCRISSKPGPDGLSAMEVAMRHIYSENRIAGASPFVFQPPGPMIFMGKQVLNTYHPRIMKPVGEAQEWAINFPLLASIIENMFDPASQQYHFLAWFKHFYETGLENKPMPGQNIFLMGGAGVGKTLMNRVIIGGAVGGFMDASEFLIRNGSFNSELFDVPLWCVDDETAGDSEAARTAFSSMLKKVAANQTFRHNRKFEVPSMTEWMGRVICTMNLDFVSSRLLGSLDNTSADKTSLFRCAEKPKIKFPSRYALMGQVEKELPFFLRWLVDWEPGPEITRDVRYGYLAFHEKSLMTTAQQGAKSAPFKELLVEALRNYFEGNKEAKEWQGSVTKVMRLILTNPMNDIIIRTLKLEQTNRYLEAIQREGQIKCSVVTGEQNERVWVFERI